RVPAVEHGEINDVRARVAPFSFAIPVTGVAELGSGEAEIADVAGDRRDRGVFRPRVAGEGGDEVIDLIPRVFAVVDLAHLRKCVPDRGGGPGCFLLKEPR